MQQSSLGPSVEQPAQLPVDAPAVRERTSARGSTAGGQRAARHDRTVDRRTTLSSLVAELSAAAASIEDDIAASVVTRLGTLDTDAVAAPTVSPRVPRTSTAPVRLQAMAATVLDADVAGRDAAPAAPAQVHLTGRREATAQDLNAGDSEPIAASGEDTLRTTAQLEAARAEADVLFTRVSAEQAARADAEQRLADAQDELRFLRAEVQMTGHQHRRAPGPLRRALRTITGRRRPVVPANNPKKERLGV